MNKLSSGKDYYRVIRALNTTEREVVLCCCRGAAAAVVADADIVTAAAVGC